MAEKPRPERLEIIDKTIASGCFPSRQKLADLCKTTVLTIQRDIDYLKTNYHAPIENNRIHKGYEYTNKSYRLPSLFVSENQIKAARLMKNLLESMNGTPLYGQAKEVFDLLSTAVPDVDLFGETIKSSVYEDKMKDRVVFLSAPTSEFNQQIWNTVTEAMEKSFSISFDYKRYNDTETEHFTVYPLQLFYDDGDWFLWAYIYLQKNYRLFRLCKVQNLELYKAVDPIQVDKNNDFRQKYKGHFGCYSNGNIQHYKVFIYNNTTAYERTKRKTWGENQVMTFDEQGNMILEFDSNQIDPILTWVHSWACDIEPLEPEELYMYWRDRNIHLNQRIQKIEEIRNSKEYKTGMPYIPLDED